MAPSTCIKQIVGVRCLYPRLPFEHNIPRFNISLAAKYHKGQFGGMGRASVFLASLSKPIIKHNLCANNINLIKLITNLLSQLIVIIIYGTTIILNKNRQYIQI